MANPYSDPLNLATSFRGPPTRGRAKQIYYFGYDCRKNISTFYYGVVALLYTVTNQLTAQNAELYRSSVHESYGIDP